MEYTEIIAWGLTVLMGVLTKLLHGKWKELKEALKVTVDAIQDDKITKKELQSIVKEWKEVLQKAD